MTADEKYEAAMAESGQLLARMQAESNSNDAAVALMADIWSQRTNTPFLTTVYEASQEVLAPGRAIWK